VEQGHATGQREENCCFSSSTLHKSQFLDEDGIYVISFSSETFLQRRKKKVIGISAALIIFFNTKVNVILQSL